MNRISRRDFIKQSTFAAAALSLAPMSLADISYVKLQRKDPPKKVIVIGAGLAGLSAAYELTQAGHDVTVLEAQMRPGGRVLTLRHPFADGLYAEAGATGIPDNHYFTLRYVKLFHLPLDPSLPSKLAGMYYLQGTRIIVSEGATVELPLQLTEQEKALMREWKLWQTYVGPGAKEVAANPAAPNWQIGSLQKYDQMSYHEFLLGQGASEAAIKFLTLGYGYADIDNVSALQILRDLVDENDAKNWYKIRGGTDLLPNAFAAQLAEKIQYGCAVVKIEHDAQGVRVTFLQGGTNHKVAGDHLICAIPFSVLKEVEVYPPFSPNKQKTIEQLPIRSATRVFLQSKKRFWIEQGLDGWAQTDLPIMNVNHVTSNQAGQRGILESLMKGSDAKRAMLMKESERISFVLENMEKVFPGIRENFEGGFSKSWDEDPWARGHSCFFKPGQMAELWPEIARPEGRVHFAGDHTSAWFHWMNGALESGNRVAREVNEAP